MPFFTPTLGLVFQKAPGKQKGFGPIPTTEVVFCDTKGGGGMDKAYLLPLYFGDNARVGDFFFLFARGKKQDIARANLRIRHLFAQRTLVFRPSGKF